MFGNNKYRVKGWVDSQNSFGATVRTEFSMVMQPNADGWRGEDITIDQE